MFHSFILFSCLLLAISIFTQGLRPVLFASNTELEKAGQNVLIDSGSSSNIRNGGHGAAEAQLRTKGRAFALGEIIFEESLDETLFWVEGNSERVSNENGRLILDANHPEDRVLTVFIDRWFEGDLYFGYEAQIVASDTAARYPPPRDVNNINTFLYYSDPGGRDLQATQQNRADASYRHYHELSGYIVTFLNGYMPEVQQKARNPDYKIVMEENTGRIRLRENPGFVLKNEAFSEKSEIGRVYQMEFVFAEDELYFFIDGKFQLSFRPSAENRVNAGYFGFRTFATKMAIDNFVVRRVEVRRDESN